VHAREDIVLRRLLSLETVAMVFFTMSIPVEVVLARHSFHAGASGYGLLLSAWGAGGVAGSTFYARWRRLSSRLLMTVGTCLFGAGFLTMAVAPSLVIAIAGSAIGGAGNGVQMVAFRTALQEASPERWIALMLSLNEFIFQAVPGIGILLGGAIASLAGPRTALGAGAGGSLLVALAIWFKLRPIATQAKVEESAPDAEPLGEISPLTARQNPPTIHP
jgi:MFS family permease